MASSRTSVPWTRRPLLAALIAALLAACEAPPLRPDRDREPAPPDPVERALEAVVGVRVGRSWGSGVIIDPIGVVLTASHVLDGAGRARLSLWDGRRRTARVVLDNPSGDYAVLALEGEAEPLAWLAISAPPALGAPVSLLAMRSDETVRREDGAVRMRRASLPMTGETAQQLGASYFRDAILHSASGTPGDSGGALVDGEGQLVGINLALGVQRFTLAAPAEPFGAALPALRGERTGDPPFARLAAPQWPASPAEEVSWMLDGLLDYAAALAPERRTEAERLAAGLLRRAERWTGRPADRELLRWTWTEFLGPLALPDPLVR